MKLLIPSDAPFRLDPAPEGVEVVDEAARGGLHRGRERPDGVRGEREARDAREVGLPVALPEFDDLEERAVGLAEDHGVGAGGDVEVGGVRGVRAVDGDERP